MKRILIADPNETTRYLYRVLFGKLGHSVTETSESEGTLAAIIQSEVDKNPFDVLIVNQVIPGPFKDGCELIQIAKGRVGTIIMATGTNCKDKAIAAGANEFLFMPFHTERLAGAI